MYGAAVSLLIICLTGCASAPPRWHGGYIDGLTAFYDQGTGAGETIDRADRNARIALVGYQQGIEVESVTQNQVQAFTQHGDELIVEVLTARGLQRVSGSLPAGAYPAERWQDRQGTWWSYYLAAKPNGARRVQELRDARLVTARRRSVVPGWAQFTKGEQRKGWRLVAAEGTGLIGLATCAVLQQDVLDRRDRVRSNASDYEYYDDWANRLYWGTVAFGTLAGGTYLYSLLDGMAHVPPTYKLLLSQTHLQPRPAGGVALIYQYDIK
jgi:hypothetical protein